MGNLGPLLRTAAAAIFLLPALLPQQSLAWGHDAHSMINRLAGATLPPDVPEFLRSPAALDALAYYGPQPDQWRSEDTALYATLVPEHDLNFELAELIGPLPRTRYDYLRALAAAQAKHPDLKLDPQSVGLLPYSATETYTMLKSSMRDYRALLAAKQDTKPAEAEIVFLAGFLGHYVGDGSQPLHLTVNYNGWIGPNPHGYTTEHTIHSRFEGDYVHNNIKAANVAPLIPAKPVVLDDVFADYVAYLRHSHSFVEKVYQLDKTGAFTGAGTPEGKAFVDERLAAGATELRDMIYTAWVKSDIPIPPHKSN
ncbi:MAG: nuclease [Acidobacteriaceae bacterium]|jgi:hypothetical protein